MWVTVLWSQGCWLLPWGVVIGAAITAAVFDVSARRIPNWLTGPVLLAGLVWAACVGKAPGLADALAAMFLCAAPYVILFAFGGGGAGDAKLMGALGAWLGVLNGAVALTAVAVSGIVSAAIYAAARKQGAPAWQNVRQFTSTILWRLAGLFVGRIGPPGQAREMPSHGKMLKMPYSVAILCGVCVAAAGVYVWRVWVK